MVIQIKSPIIPISESPLILIDGDCIVCNGFAKFVLSKINGKVFYFSSIHSDTGKMIIKELKLETVDSIIFICSNQVFTYSSALLHIFRLLGRPWSLVYYCFNWFPVRLRDTVYKIFAKNRFIFGRKNDSCLIPSSHITKRILK